MSFGFAIGDFIAAGQLAWTLYRDCYTVARNAPQEFQLLLGEISTLCNSLKMLEEEVKNEQSTLVRAGEDRVRMVNEMVAGISETLKRLKKVASKYGILGSAGSKAKHIWIKIKWSAEFKSVDSLRSKLVYHNTVMNLLLTSVANSSLGRIETSTKTLQSDIADIKSHLQTSQDNNNNSPLLASMVEDEVYKLSLSAELMKNAETLQPWSSISVDKWVQSGKWWLLRSQLEIYAPTKPNDHSVPVSAYTNLIKASWILIDIIDHHPQLTLVTTDTRLEVLLLAAELKQEFRRIHELTLATPDWEIIEQQDLRIWENNTRGPVLQPSKRSQKTKLVQTQTDFWVVRGEQVYFQKFSLYQRSDLTSPQTCVVLFLMHKHERSGRLVAQDQHESSLIEFKLREDLYLEVEENGKSLKVGFNNDIYTSFFDMVDWKKSIKSLKVGTETLRFNLETDVQTLLTLIESAYVYLFRRDSDILDLKIFEGFALLTAAKNGSEIVINRLKQNSTSLDPETLSSALTVGSSPAPEGNNVSGYLSYLNESLYSWAVGHGLVGIIRILLAERLRVDMGRYLCYAVELKKETIVQILLENSADPDARSHLQKISRFEVTPLGQASRSGQLKLAQMLLKKGANINARSGKGQTALHMAIKGGHTDVVDLLLEKKEVDINAIYSRDTSSEEGMTPLHVAVRNGRYDLTQKLLERGANVNAKETLEVSDIDKEEYVTYTRRRTWGKTPLLLAVERAAESQEESVVGLDMIQLLLANGVYINAEAGRETRRETRRMYQNRTESTSGRMSGITPLYAAIESARDEILALVIVRLLLRHGANVHLEAWNEDELSTDEQGSEKRYERVSGATPLRLAVKRGYKDIVKLLFESGAIRDREAIEFAKEGENCEIEQLLQDMDT